MSTGSPLEPTAWHARVEQSALVEQSPLDVPVPTQEERRHRDRADAAGLPYVLFREPNGVQRLLPLLAERIVIGRSESAEVSLRWDARVSRTHATLESTPGGWLISDGGLSTNGTFVNRVRVSEPRLLADRDVVQVGNTALAFRAPGGGSAGRSTGRFAR